MHSPLHSEVIMVPVEIEPGLNALQCPASKGFWIPLQSYLIWRERYRDRQVPLPSGEVSASEDDSTRAALFCPESGCLLQRFQVGHGLPFRIDRSPVTGGIWLDQGEWEALKGRDLHVELHQVFTAGYQKKVRSAQLQQTVLQAFREKIGEDDFERVGEFKSWLSQHPRSRDIICYLLDSEKSEA